MKDAHKRSYVEYVAARLPWMRKVAFLLARDWHRADDICQTALTQLYVHWNKASTANNIDGYVRTTIVRVYLGDRRTAWATRVDLVGSIGDEDPHAAMTRDGAAGLDDVTGTAARGLKGLVHLDGDPDTRMLIESALADLSPPLRAALVLRYYCDLSVEETAAILRCSAGAVKTRTFRGLESLRRVLESHHVTVEG